MRHAPYRLFGPFASFDEAATFGEQIGNDFVMDYGEHMPDADRYRPMPEPRGER